MNFSYVIAAFSMRCRLLEHTSLKLHPSRCARALRDISSSVVEQQIDDPPVWAYIDEIYSSINRTVSDESRNRFSRDTHFLVNALRRCNHIAQLQLISNWCITGEIISNRSKNLTRINRLRKYYIDSNNKRLLASGTSLYKTHNRDIRLYWASCQLQSDTLHMK